MANNKIRIRLKSFDHKILDSSAEKIIGAAKKSGAQVVGPVPLPTTTVTGINKPSVVKTWVIPILRPKIPFMSYTFYLSYNLISMSTPLGNSNLVRISTVSCVGFTMSIKRLWVLISNCSRESLYLWTALNTV